MSSIKLSPKYGVNPTIPVCFWCGAPKNEVALMGRISGGKRGGDEEAPHYAILDYHPCEECQKKMQTGFTVMEATNSPNDRAPVAVSNGAYPTGRYIVLVPDAAVRIFGEKVAKQGKCYMESRAYVQMFGRFAPKG